MVTVIDIMRVAANWGQAGGPEDVNNDGTVDVNDVQQVAGTWRETCHVLAETVKYYALGGQRITMRKVPAGQAGTLYYLFGDHLGSTSVSYRSDGGDTRTQRYYPWGAVRSGDVPTDHRFTGQRWDATIDLYDYNARWYDPALGRFTQPDTIVPNPGNPQNLNRYTYVRNNPLRYTDPSGHAVCMDADCNWVEHPVTGQLTRRRYTSTSPSLPTSPSPDTYDRAEARHQAWQLVYEWFFERGAEVRYFGPNDTLTQDIMYDPGMGRFRGAWAAAGYPVPWTWRHSADQREGGFWVTRVVKGGLVYAREHLFELSVSTLGFGSKTPQGPIDPVGGTIGSLDEIHVLEARDGMVMIEVRNWMGWALFSVDKNRPSGTRIPGTNRSLIPDMKREHWFPFGGTIQQRFTWWEPIPSLP